MPGGAVAFSFGLEFAQEGLLELKDLDHLRGRDEGLSGGGRRIGQQHVFEVIGAGRQDGSTLVDLGGVEQVEDGQMLDGENFVHALDAETAFAVEEVGDVGLLKSSLLGKAEAR